MRGCSMLCSYNTVYVRGEEFGIIFEETVEFRKVAGRLANAGE